MPPKKKQAAAVEVPAARASRLIIKLKHTDI
jgi:hypothetical protein